MLYTVIINKIKSHRKVKRKLVYFKQHLYFIEIKLKQA